MILLFSNKVSIQIKGKNIDRFIKRLMTNKVEMLKIKYLKYNKVNILIYKKDLAKIYELKTVYEVTEKEIYGIIKVLQVLNIYKVIILFIFIGVLIICFLSNIIFNVSVIHSDKELRELILTELETYGISKYKFKLSYNDLQTIKEEILNNHKNEIEWLEIISLGTSYIVRVEERIINEQKTVTTLQNIVASKSALLLKIEAQSGVIVKEKNSYINKGEVVISNEVSLNEEVKDNIPATGKIYGEVWYTINVDYPFMYNEIRETNNVSSVYTISYLNNIFEINKQYENKKIENEVLFSHLFLPISFNQQLQREVLIIDEFLDEEEAYEKAYEKAIITMSEKLDSDEYIIKSEIIDNTINDSGVSIKVFFSIYENITAYEKVEVENDIP